MDYEIKELEAGSARVEFADGAWADVPIIGDDSVEMFESRVATYATKNSGNPPSWASIGKTGSVTPPSMESTVDPAWLVNRKSEYGALASQIEYITENGLEAWQTEVARIKAKYPQT